MELFLLAPTRGEIAEVPDGTPVAVRAAGRADRPSMFDQVEVKPVNVVDPGSQSRLDRMLGLLRRGGGRNEADASAQPQHMRVDRKRRHSQGEQEDAGGRFGADAREAD